MSSMTHGDSITDNITLQDFFHQTRLGYHNIITAE